MSNVYPSFPRKNWLNCGLFSLKCLSNKGKIDYFSTTFVQSFPGESAVKHALTWQADTWSSPTAKWHNYCSSLSATSNSSTWLNSNYCVGKTWWIIIDCNACDVGATAFKILGILTIYLLYKLLKGWILDQTTLSQRSRHCQKICWGSPSTGKTTFVKEILQQKKDVLAPLRPSCPPWSEVDHIRA